ncbi:hypothetical protein D3C80_388310 [compost metagenome]
MTDKESRSEVIATPSTDGQGEAKGPATAPKPKTKRKAKTPTSAMRTDSRFEKLPQSFWEAFQLQSEDHARKIGIETLRMLFLVNGGALVALLAYMGNSAGKAGVPGIDVVAAIRPFGFGLVAIAVAALLSSLAMKLLTAYFLAEWQKHLSVRYGVVGGLLQLFSGLATAISLSCAVWGFHAAVGLYGETEAAVVAREAATDAKLSLLRAELAEAKVRLELGGGTQAEVDARAAALKAAEAAL